MGTASRNRDCHLGVTREGPLDGRRGIGTTGRGFDESPDGVEFAGVEIIADKVPWGDLTDGDPDHSDIGDGSVDIVDGVGEAVGYRHSTVVGVGDDTGGGVHVGDEAIDRTNVATHYSIWVQGKGENIFIASSYSADPVPFVLGRGDNVFPGWDEGVNGMKQGGKRLLIIPPDLALGEDASSGIPANSTLIMEIELMEVVQPETITEVDDDAYITTESGLKYYDLEDGQGSAVTAGQTVVVHYTGWLEDGTQFDSSQEFGQPFTFELGAGQVIAGWDEGVIGMKISGIRQLIIPAELGYGAAGAGDIIPPDAVLIFQVELIEIKD